MGKPAGRGKGGKKEEAEDGTDAPASPAPPVTPLGKNSGGSGKKKQRAREEEEARGGSGGEGGAKRRKGPNAGGERREREGRGVSVHVARFVELQPAAITTMAHDDTLKILAVGRGNGDIQLWSTVAPRWHPIGVCVGAPGSQIRAVCWAQSRLFSASLDGRILEWSLSTLAPAAAEDSHGGSVWSLAASRDGNYLAAACHDGAVRIFAVTEEEGGGAVFRKALPAHDGQALSVAWGPGDQSLIAGDSLGNVRVWPLGATPGARLQYQSALLVSVRADVGGGRKSQVLVWAVCSAGSGTVFAGDSQGRTHIIDSRMGIVEKVLVAHHGSDVLALASDEASDGASAQVFSAGVDGRVVHYRKVTNGSVDGAGSSNMAADGAGGSGFGFGGMSSAPTSWVVAAAARYHTHDVRTLCLAGRFPAAAPAAATFVPPTDPSHPLNRKAARAARPGHLAKMLPCVVSGGLDTQLCLYTFERPSKPSKSRATSSDTTSKGAAGGSMAGMAGALAQAARLPPWPYQPCVSVSAPRVLPDGDREVRMLAVHSSSLDLWRWRLSPADAPPTKGSKGSASPGGEVAVGAGPGGGAAGGPGGVEPPRYAVRINTAADDNIACAAISPDGAWVACAHASRLSLYKLTEDDDGTLDVDKVNIPKAVARGSANAVTFLRAAQCLAVADRKGDILLIDLATLEVRATLRTGGGGDTQSGPTAVNLLQVSDDGEWLASADLSGQVHIWSLETERLHASLPALPARLSAMRFVPSPALSRQVLSLVTAENRLYLYEVEGKRLTAFPSPDASGPGGGGAVGGGGEGPGLLDHPEHVCGIAFNPAQSNSVLLWGHSFLCQVDIDSPLLPSAKRRVSKHQRAPRGEDKPDKVNFKMIYKYSPVLAVDYLVGDNLVVVERPWLQLLASIGGTLHRKRFGK